MATRTHKTRHKPTQAITVRLPPTKPRNPLVAPAAKRVAGAHRKSISAERVAERVALERALRTDDVEKD
jgi:hypothetical protein